MTIDQIKSGDLLIWYDNYSTWYNNILLYIVRLFTRSEYGHVGVAWVICDRVFVIEATMPVIRIMPVTLDRPFYRIAMNIDWNKEYESFLIEKVGLDYSLLDAIRAYFGKTLADDDKWQCAELALAFYKLTGINLNNEYTPSELVKALLSKHHKSLEYIGDK